MARPFVWTPQKEQALQLEWEGRLTQAQIAAHVGVTRRMVEGWARRPAWRKRLQARANAYRRALRHRMRAQWQREIAAWRF